MDKKFEQNLREIVMADINQLVEKDSEYGSSWKRRGGVGAFMMLARKWDRLERAVELSNWDIFVAAQNDQRTESILDDIGDLRRYLILVETELRRTQSELQSEPRPSCDHPAPFGYEGEE